MIEFMSQFCSKILKLGGASTPLPAICLLRSVLRSAGVARARATPSRRRAIILAEKFWEEVILKLVKILFLSFYKVRLLLILKQICYLKSSTPTMGEGSVRDFRLEALNVYKNWDRNSKMTIFRKKSHVSIFFFSSRGPIEKQKISSHRFWLSIRV